ncbi:MAG TPA: hypothetical protein VK137_20710, partial [Planctomycetaceae bacterium]|nr:hypothetical protein [Planctomycetaceae bacterium]
MFTVRGKLMFGVSLVLAMVGTLAVSSLWAIWSYRDVVNDLDRNLNRVPQRRELVGALAALFDPLFEEFPRTQKGRLARQRMFEQRLTAAELLTREELQKLADLPAAEYASTREVAQDRLWEIDQRFQALRREQVQLTNADLADQTAKQLLLEVAELQTWASSMPEFGTGLTGLLRSAKKTYKAGIWWVSVSTLLVVMLLGGVVVGGYR